MAVHPLTTSHVRAFVKALEEWAEALWAMTVDVPFVIAGSTNRSVIFNMRFRMDVLEGDPILMMDPIIGRMLR